MGCASSTPRVANSRGKASSRNNNKPTPTNTVLSSMVAPPDEGDECAKMFREDMQQIFQGISRFSKTEGMVPVVSVGAYSCPILVAPLCLEAGDPTGVSLGVVNVSHSGLARIMCIGQFKFFMEATPDNAESTVFMENAIRWASCGARGVIRVCLLGMDAQEKAQIMKNLGGFGFKIACRDDGLELNKFNVIICPSDCIYGKEIGEAIEQGVSVICGASDDVDSPNRFIMNNVLAKHGVGFPPCLLVVGPINANTLKITLSFSRVSKASFKYQAERYIEMLKQPEEDIDVGELDNAISSLKYNLAVVPQGKNELLERLADVTLNALESSECYSEEGQFCTTLFQTLCAALFADLTPKLDAGYFVGKNHGKIFPGEPGLQTKVTQSIEVSFENEGWISTGLYIAPGDVVKVLLSDDAPDSVAIQIGAHTEVITNTPTPWSRWPCVVNWYKLESREIEIASMFGGPIYVVNNTQEEGSLTLTFSDAYQYPTYRNGEWNNTDEFEAPFTEVVTNYAIFTVPSSAIRNAGEIELFVSHIDHLIETVIHFTGEVHQKPYRIVFDSELPPDGPVCGYPIVLDYAQIEPIIISEDPSPQMFSLLMLIGILSLPDGYFNDDVEASLAAVAASVAFLKRWPNVSPLDYAVLVIPPNFSDVWSIYSNEKDKALIPKALRRTRTKHNNGKTDMWAVFVLELKKFSGTDYSYLIPKKSDDNAKATGVVMSVSSHSLQGFQLDDDDIFRLK